MSIAKISIIIPVYNIERYLCRCVDSVINQTMKPYEIILVDDGSKDGCAEICDNYEKNEDNIKVIHKKNEGLGFARNSGLEIATGDYIVFIDGDDYINSTRIETLYNCIRKNNADTCIASYTRVIDNNFIEIPNLMDGKILKGVEIIEGHLMPDHIHMLVSIPPKISVSSFMGYLKGKSALMIFERHANLKYKYGNRHFWCRGYYVDTVGKNAKKIEEYIRNQLQED